MSSSLLDEPLVVTPLTKAMRRIPIDADEQWRRIFVFFCSCGLVSFRLLQNCSISALVAYFQHKSMTVVNDNKLVAWARHNFNRHDTFLLNNSRRLDTADISEHRKAFLFQSRCCFVEFPG